VSGRAKTGGRDGLGAVEAMPTGTARDGKRVEVQGCDFYTFRGEQVIGKDSYWKIVEG
jgi:hypothetical protein